MVTLSPEELAQASATGLGPLTQFALWDWLAGRLDVLWWMIRHAFQRLVLLFAWWPFLLLAAVFATADGWLRRRIRQAGFAYASPLRHHYAVRAMLWLVLLGLFGLFLPVPWSPWLIPCYGRGLCRAAGRDPGQYPETRLTPPFWPKRAVNCTLSMYRSA